MRLQLWTKRRHRLWVSEPIEDDEELASDALVSNVDGLFEVAPVEEVEYDEPEDRFGFC